MSSTNDELQIRVEKLRSALQKFDAFATDVTKFMTDKEEKRAAPVPSAEMLHQAFKEITKASDTLFAAVRAMELMCSAFLEKMLANLERLEEKGYAGLYRTRRGIALARITLSGLQEVHPPEYYKHIPEWMEQQDMF